MVAGTLNIKGQRYVVIPETEYLGYVGHALPSLPVADADGTVDALAFSRASIARDIIRDRQKLGLSQAELARRAGIRPETLNRIEKLKTSAATRILERIDQALTRAKA
jgi:DNA-binding XRE family transcriptional regulator